MRTYNWRISDTTITYFMILSCYFWSSLVRKSNIFVFSLTSSTSKMSHQSTRKKSAALIFLHGLGDTPDGWSSLQTLLPSIRQTLSNVTYLFPPAPTIPISINGGFRMPGWFDIYSWPIAVGDKDDMQGILAAVRQVEKQVEDLHKSGIPHRRIIIGGFSQGGAIALQTVYNDAIKADKNIQYGACICLSGWLTRADDIREIGLSDAAKDIPLFWGHGSQDDKVLFSQQKFGEDILRKHGIKTLISKQYSVGHSSTEHELKDFANFLDEILFQDLIEGE